MLKKVIRAEVFTVGEIMFNNGRRRLEKARNLDKKTENEIKTKMLSFGYTALRKTSKTVFSGIDLQKLKQTTLSYLDKYLSNVIEEFSKIYI